MCSKLQTLSENFTFELGFEEGVGMGLYAAATIVTAIYPFVFWLPGNWTVHDAVSSVSVNKTRD